MKELIKSNNLGSNINSTKFVIRVQFNEIRVIRVIQKITIPQNIFKKNNND